MLQDVERKKRMYLYAIRPMDNRKKSYHSNETGMQRLLAMWIKVLHVSFLFTVPKYVRTSKQVCRTHGME